MNRWMNKSLALVLLVVFLLMNTSSPVLAKSETQYAEPSASELFTDFVVVRPTNLAATIVGTGFFIVTLPFTAMGGNAGHAGRILVVNPAKYTFARPLGDYEAMAFWPFKYGNPQER